MKSVQLDPHFSRLRGLADLDTTLSETSSPLSEGRLMACTTEDCPNMVPDGAGASWCPTCDFKRWQSWVDSRRPPKKGSVEAVAHVKPATALTEPDYSVPDLPACPESDLEIGELLVRFIFAPPSKLSLTYPQYPQEDNKSTESAEHSTTFAHESNLSDLSSLEDSDEELPIRAPLKIFISAEARLKLRLSKEALLLRNKAVFPGVSLNQRDGIHFNFHYDTIGMGTTF